jgi:hypothetical protein
VFLRLTTPFVCRNENKVTSIFCIKRMKSAMSWCSAGSRCSECQASVPNLMSLGRTEPPLYPPSPTPLQLYTQFVKVRKQSETIIITKQFRT